MTYAEECFFRYIAFDTQSNENSGTHPSTPGQLVLAKVLRDELEKLGAENPGLTSQGYVTAFFPATPGLEDAPALGLIAHMDTSDAASGKDVRARIVHYEGGPIALGQGDKQLFPGDEFLGHDLVVTDGTTLLGADDKAGIAAIMALLKKITDEKLPHGRLCIGFTPDEEIGEGTRFFDVRAFGADYAFTVDGSSPNCIEYQNFNAAGATAEFYGVPVHPGSARDMMVNAAKLAMEFNALLPADEVPEKTSGFEGFFHLTDMKGDVSHAEVRYIIRDHDAASFEKRLEMMKKAAASISERYGEKSIKLKIYKQYRNMAEIITRHPEVLEAAEQAVRKTGLTPEYPPVRGGTDGARLSFDGLPCPNLGNGGHNFHGEYEFLSLQELEQSCTVLLHLVNTFSTMKK